MIHVTKSCQPLETDLDFEQGQISEPLSLHVTQVMCL